MVRSVDVLCRDCKKKLAHWDMFHNLQYEEEWECPAMFRQRIKGWYRSKDGKSKANFQDEEHPIPLKSKMNYCALVYKTKYCRKCAERRHFRCGRPRCKGRLVKVRNKDGSSTKHTHGGF